MRNILRPLLSLKTKKGYSIFSIIVVVLFSTWVISDALKSEVVVAADGETKIVKTTHDTVGDLLDELGIEVEEHDHISHSVKTQIEDGMEIFFKTAKEIKLTIDEEEHTYYTTADTVDQFFKEKDISFSEHDEVSHELSQLIEDQLNIVVNTAFKVVINDGGKKTKVWTTGGTVEQVLEENNITYGKLDRINPSLNEELSEKSSKIEVVNVKVKEETFEEKLAFGTEERNDSSLEKGTKQTLSDGKDGLVARTYKITFENGKEVDRKLIEEEVKKKSKNQIVAVGTKEKKQTAVAASNSKGKSNNSSNPPSGGREFVMQATAYTANCNGCSGYTATGINLNANRHAKVIAVDPNVIPLGSKVWVEGYGTAIAGDTGGSIRGNRIDAHVPTKGDAQRFGRRTVRVKVLD